MSEPFLGEIRIVSFNFAPRGWAVCNGQVLPINQNQALFSLLGTTYGGNGQTTFALPDLRGRVPLHMGGGFVAGQAGGEAQHTLTVSELPPHIHSVGAMPGLADKTDPTGRAWAGGRTAYASSANTTMNAASIGTAGASQGHDNLSPYLTLTFCIALQGIFPSRT